jgi:hypothetical protein
MTAGIGKTIGRVLGFGILVGVFLSLAACVIDDGPTGLLIVQDQWIQSGTGTTDCTVPVEPTATRRVEGVLDVAVLSKNSTRYYLYPVVENLLEPLSGQTSGTASLVEEMNNIIMKSFHVKLDVATSAGTSIPWDAGCPGEFDSPVDTWHLAPASTISEIVEIIRPCNAAPLFDSLQAAPSGSSITVTATIRAKGHLGSSDIESPPFTFPVQVCYGCLQMEYSDPAAAQFSFPAIPQCSALTVNPYTGNPCNPAQDGTILCCALGVDAQGHATGVLCPAVPMPAAPTDTTP